MPCADTFKWRDRDSSHDIHDVFFKTSCPVNQPFSAMKKIKIPKVEKYKKTQLSPLMFNENLPVENDDTSIIQKYYDKEKSKLDETAGLTNHGKNKMHFVGASSLFVG